MWGLLWPGTEGTPPVTPLSGPLLARRLNWGGTPTQGSPSFRVQPLPAPLACTLVLFPSPVFKVKLVRPCTPSSLFWSPASSLNDDTQIYITALDSRVRPAWSSICMVVVTCPGLSPRPEPLSFQWLQPKPRHSPHVQKEDKSCCLHLQNGTSSQVFLTTPASIATPSPWFYNEKTESGDGGFPRLTQEPHQGQLQSSLPPCPPKSGSGVSFAGS